METTIMLVVLVFILFAFIAIGGAVYHTVKNRRLVRQMHVEYDQAMATADPEPEAVATELFFTREEKTGKTVKFYASAPSLGVEIPIEEPILCDYEEVCAFVDRISDSTGDNFFVLEDEGGNCIQFMHDGDGSERLDLDIPVAAEKGSYRGEFSSLKDAKACIRSFYSGVNIAFDYPVTFETW